jgi:hypothetical protein
LNSGAPRSILGLVAALVGDLFNLHGRGNNLTASWKQNLTPRAAGPAIRGPVGRHGRCCTFDVVIDQLRRRSSDLLAASLTVLVLSTASSTARAAAPNPAAASPAPEILPYDQPSPPPLRTTGEPPLPVLAPPPAMPLFPPVAAPPAARGVRTHDGFFLRLRLGFGPASAARNGSADTFDVNGFGGSFGASFGHVVAPNLVVYGEIFDSIITAGRADQNHASLGSGMGGVVDGIGPGASYYFGASNFYVAACVGIGLLQVNLRPTPPAGLQKLNYQTSLGYAFNLGVGKEWWVSDDWGIGAVVQLAYGQAPDKEMPTETWRATGIALLFSATYN